MEKILFNACLYEVYKEILFLTTNYQKETLTIKDIDKLNSSDFDNLKKSKQLFNFSIGLKDLDTSLGEVNFDPKFISILESKEYDKESLTYIIEYLNNYAIEHIKYIKELEERVGYVLDLKRGMDGYKGEYPLYFKVNENLLLMERAIVSLNTLSILNKESKNLSFKVTYMEYRVPLDEYKFNDIDIREKTKKEIVELLDSSIKVNLQNAYYYNSSNQLINYQEPFPSKGELSILLDKKIPEQENFKTALKKSLMSTLKTLGIIIIFTILFFIFKYLGK